MDMPYSVSNMVAPIKDVGLESITRKGDITEVTFFRYTYRGQVMADISIKTSFYTFNVPLTCAILVAFHLFIKRKRRA
ncbi:MAG: hypothetical protein U9N19_06130, partial [Thermodesulfobacteriota bacterium]|nr:hypothetical protein [Thermodesulfobacteriota bacterium]